MYEMQEVLNKLECGERLKDYLHSYLYELRDTDAEKYHIELNKLAETTEPINIENSKELDEYLNKIHHPIVEEKGLWDVSDTSKIANSIGVNFNDTWYNEYSFNYVMNMVRADNYDALTKFCNEYPSAKQYIVDNPKFYAYLAHAWLSDADAPKSKLMLYLKNIVD